MLNNSDLLRGMTDTIILSQLSESDSYGYQINKTICEATENLLELKEATLYTCFRRMEENGLISSYWGNENLGARRRYYCITDKGRVTLDENKNDWNKLKEMISALIN